MSNIKPKDLLREGYVVTIHSINDDIYYYYTVGKDHKGELYLYQVEDTTGVDFTLSEFNDNLVLKSNANIRVEFISAVYDFEGAIKNKFANNENTMQTIYHADNWGTSRHLVIDINRFFKLDDAVIITEKKAGAFAHGHFSRYDKDENIIYTFANGRTSFTAYDDKLEMPWSLEDFDIKLVNESKRKLFNKE